MPERASSGQRHRTFAAITYQLGIFQQLSGFLALGVLERHREESYFFSSGGVYHTGEVQARCWTVAATFGFGGRFSLAAQYVDQRGVGISSTRAK